MRVLAKPEKKTAADFLPLLEILIAWGLIEATTWASGANQRHLFWIAALFILASTLIHRPPLQELGLGVRGLRSSLWVIPAAAALASSAILLAEAAGTLHPLFGFIGIATHSTAYVIWAVFQQFILQSYFFLRFEKLVPARDAAILSASLFCLAHIPNPVLVTVCLFAGWFACEIFRRNRNIYALGVAHAILGLTIAVTVPDNLHRHMRVGIGYYHYQTHRTTLGKG